MLLEVESAKSAAYYAGWCANEMNDELPQVASLAKSYCSEAYFHASAENIQIHGGIGFTWSTRHLYFKRAKSSSCCSVIPPTTASCSPSESAFEPGTVLTTPRSYASAYGLGVLRFRCSARHGNRALRSAGRRGRWRANGLRRCTNCRPPSIGSPTDCPTRSPPGSPTTTSPGSSPGISTGSPCRGFLRAW